MSRLLLLVEDDSALAQVMARGLDRRGYEVVIAHDRDAARDAVRAHVPEFALVDLRLGEDSGLDVISDVHEVVPEARIIVLTGYASIATAVEAIKRGASEYLTKPAAIEDLARVLEGEGAKQIETSVPDEPMSVRRLTWEHINRVLSETENNISEAARRLGMHRRTLQRMLQKRPPNR